MMNGKAEVACDHHDALAHRLVIERLRFRRYRQLSRRQLAADGVDQLLFDHSHAVERQRAADTHAKLDEQHRAGRPGAHPFHRNDPRDLARDCGDPLAYARGRSIRERVDCAAAEPIAGNADKDGDYDRGCGIGPRVTERHAA